MDNPDQPPKPTDPVLAALNEQRIKYEADPKHLNPPGTYPKFTPTAQRYLDKLNRKITDRLRELRAERGDPVNEAGYTGPKQKRK